MNTIRIANHTYTVDNKHALFTKLAQKFLVDGEGELITISDADMDRERGLGDVCSEGGIELVAIHRKIADKIFADDICMMHGVAIAAQGNAYIFTAPSGTGKSTHARLWCKLFDVEIINGDKPMLDFKSDPIVAYGTPWCGKEMWCKNDSAPLAGIVIIKRSDDGGNHIRRLTPREAMVPLMKQMYIPCDSNATAMHKLLRYIDRLASLPVYELHCTISDDAARLSYNTLTHNILTHNTLTHNTLTHNTLTQNITDETKQIDTK